MNMNKKKLAGGGEYRRRKEREGEKGGEGRERKVERERRVGRNEETKEGRDCLA